MFQAPSVDPLICLPACLPFYHSLAQNRWNGAENVATCQGTEREREGNRREGEREMNILYQREGEKKTRENESMNRQRDEDKVGACVRAREAGMEGGPIGSSRPCAERPPPSLLAGAAARRLVAPPLLPPPNVPSSSSPAMRGEED